MNLLEKSITNFQTILSLIPQKPPFVMVDTLLYYDPVKTISGFKIRKDNILLEDGFLTEAGLIENMAQTVALHTGYFFYINKIIPPEGYIGAIKELTINRLPCVDDVLQTEIHILHEIMGVTLVKGKTTLNGEVLIRGELKTVLKK